MIDYEDRVRRELWEWEQQLLKPPGMLERTTKKLQDRINDVIPEKAQQALTLAVRGVVQSVLVGMDYIPKSMPQLGLTLEERDEKARELLSTYKKIAAAEGAGTGAGGFLLGLVDFPAFVAIKMKFLFELAHLYGYHTADYRERLFLLHLFQLTYSGAEKRGPLMETVKRWEHTSAQWPVGEEYLHHIDWEQFQREYRDSLDLRKLLQLVPGFGAIIGAWANYELLEELGQTATNGFRLRVIFDPST